MEIVVEEVMRGQVFLQVFRFFPSLSFQKCSVSIFHLSHSETYVLLASDRIIKGNTSLSPFCLHITCKMYSAPFHTYLLLIFSFLLVFVNDSHEHMTDVSGKEMSNIYIRVKE
jgi:hypothetical protein